MKTLETQLSNCIKNAAKVHYRTVLYLTGYNNKKVLGVVCNFIEKLGTKNILYCYVKDNKKRKEDTKGNKRSKNNCYYVEKDIRKHCAANITWCLYKDTQNILGQTFDICIFQDYELLTPNIIARGVETVAGGGIVIFLCQSLGKLSFIKSKEKNFLRRFTISLLSKKFCFCLDDKFDLKVSKDIKYWKEVNTRKKDDLICLKESLKLSDSAFYPLVNLCATYDQASCLRTLFSALRMFVHPENRDDDDHRYSVTAIVTAARGRGKSAALGMALCAALQTGVNQICVTSPSPENIVTLWQYVKLGLKVFDYSEFTDYEVTTSQLNDKSKVITKIQLKRNQQSQVIRYIEPSETESLDCDLLCIDEAAAIPLSIMQMYLRSFSGIVFVSSTVSGYEGTGRTLATKFFTELRQNFTTVSSVNTLQRLPEHSRGRLYEISLNEPIRYGNGDPVESYLYKSLCMNYKFEETDIDATLTPDQCRLVQVNRSVLFNSKKPSEELLQKIMAIYSASNHQNSPDDLMMLADDPFIRILILTDSSMDSNNPNVLVMLVLRQEGSAAIQQSSIDSIANVLSAEYMDNLFEQLVGLRIITIATNPHFLCKGFGTRALRLLVDYISGKASCSAIGGKSTSSTLLQPLQSLAPVPVNYIGVCCNVCPRLIQFFRRAGPFVVVYLDSEENVTTGDCRAILVRKIESVSDSIYTFDWLSFFFKLFSEKFGLLRYGPFRFLDHEFIKLITAPEFTITENDSFPQDEIQNFSK